MKRREQLRQIQRTAAGLAHFQATYERAFATAENTLDLTYLLFNLVGFFASAPARLPLGDSRY